MVLKYVKSSKICVWSAELDRAEQGYSEQDHAELNQGLHRHIMPNLCSSELLCSREG